MVPPRVACAEAIIAQKVEEKLIKAKEKYDIPEAYEPVMKGFFTSYMTEVYKAGKDTVVRPKLSSTVRVGLSGAL